MAILIVASFLLSRHDNPDYVDYVPTLSQQEESKKQSCIEKAITKKAMEVKRNTRQT